jgi:hypothetical protein
MQINGEDFDLVVIAAFRYALGRRTYIVPAVTNFIKANSRHIPKLVKEMIISEITDAENHEYDKSLGDEIDAKEWLSLRDFLQNE